MKQPIFTTIVLVVIGILVGFFILVSYQFNSRLRGTEQVVAGNRDKLMAIENFLTENFVKQPTK